MQRKFKECSILCLNQVTPEDIEEEQKGDSILELVLLICYSWRKIENIGHLQDQV